MRQTLAAKSKKSIATFKQNRKIYFLRFMETAEVDASKSTGCSIIKSSF